MLSLYWLLVFKQWMNCVLNNKVLYPIEKNLVFGVTRRASINYERMVKQIKDKTNPSDISAWALTADDYLVGINRFTNDLLGDYDIELFLFICY